MQRKVLIDFKDKSLFDYNVPDDLEVGAIVEVPFGRQKRQGIVTDYKIDTLLEKLKIKDIYGQIDDFALPKVSYDFLRWFCDYNMAPMGQALKMFVPSNVLKKTKLEFETPNFHDVTLSQTQKDAYNALILDNGFKVNVLNGVTGSGKTEVYFKAIDEVLKQGKQVLVMLPEIALTSQFEIRFKQRFEVNPLLWHSEIGLKDKKKIYQGVMKGKVNIIAGARSGLFLPFNDLGLIIIDEEHDHSYKQEDGITYQARDMAITRAYLGDIPIILSTATPSLETIANVRLEKYHEVKMLSRYKNASMPDIKVIDLRENKIVKLEKGDGSSISTELLSELKKNLEQGEQSLLFLNRRGYAPITLCKACGEKVLCPDCSVALVYHKETGCHHCHLCGNKLILSQKCKHCGEEGAMISVGCGVEKLQDAVKELLPEARILTISADNFSRKQAGELFSKILNQEVDIIIGTQILAKGHHFPNLTLVGVIDADLGVNVDLRSSERTYQLLEQVSGRAGRGDKKGRVYLQSYNTNHPVIKSLVNRDIDGFINNELKSREMLHMPPYGRLAGLVISGLNEQKVMELSENIVRVAKKYQKVIEVFGPIPALIFRLKTKYRFRVLMKSKKDIKLQKVISDILKEINIPSSLKIKIDIDPYNFM